MKFVGPIIALCRGRVVGDLIFLYGAFFANYLFPLGLIPFLSRILGVRGWGQLVFIQSFVQLILILLNFGFSFHGTRMIAKSRNNQLEVGQIHSQILCARALMVVPTLLLFAVSCAFIPAVRTQIPLASVGLAGGILTAFNPGWVLQGLDKMRVYSAMDTLVKILAFVGIFLMVRKSDQGWMVLAIQAASGLVVIVLTYWIIRDECPWTLANRLPIWPIFATTWKLFLFMLAGGIVNQANAFILGLFVGPTAVGIYSGGEKIVRAACALVGPFASSVHAKINYKIANKPELAAPLFFKSSFALLALGALLSAILMCGSDFIVRFALGASFASSARILRILSLIIVANWVSYNINLNYLIALHRDGPLLKCVTLGALVSIVATVILCPRFGGVGMAYASVAAEWASLAVLCLYLLRQKSRLFATIKGDTMAGSTEL